MATETDTTPSDWNVNTLKEYVSTTLNDFRDHTVALLRETDLRYQQRFDAQQKAVADALLGAEKAVNTALASADRAVLKAESAAEKRFESVNEFRRTLNDQAVTLLTRSEAEARLGALNDKVNVITGRLDRGEGTSTGVQQARVDGHMTVGSVVGIVMGTVGVLSLLGTVLVGLGSHPSASPVVPVVPVLAGADTKRVDDLIAQVLEQNRSTSSRLDALTSRLNATISPNPSH